MGVTPILLTKISGKKSPLEPAFKQESIGESSADVKKVGILGPSYQRRSHDY